METVRRLFQSSRPRTGMGYQRAILLGLSLLLGGFLADPELFGLGFPWNLIVPQTIIITIIVFFLGGVRAQRRLARLLTEAFEAVQLRQWDRAELILQQALSRPVRHPQARCELLLSLAAAAEARRQYEMAQQIYEALLEEGAGDALQLHTARVALAAAMLRTGQTTDAVTLIDRLTRVEIPEPLKAHMEIVSLLRELILGQAQNHLDRAGERRRLFREHLSTRAGYGYGLLAAAFDRANQPEAAGRHWHDATLLIRPAELVGRFQELEPVAGRYSAAEVAL